MQLLGHVSFAELLSLHARASVFCHPSRQENCGIAVVEGLASGVPLAFGYFGACVTGAADTYFITGKTPKRGTHCPGVEPPILPTASIAGPAPAPFPLPGRPAWLS